MQPAQAPVASSRQRKTQRQVGTLTWALVTTLQPIGANELEWAVCRAWQAAQGAHAKSAPVCFHTPLARFNFLPGQERGIPSEYWVH